MMQLINAGAFVAGLIGTGLYGFYMVFRYGRLGALLATAVFVTVVLAFLLINSLLTQDSAAAHEDRAAAGPRLVSPLHFHR